MATKTISQQKVSDLSHMMVKHLNDKLESIKDQVRLKIEESLTKDYPKDVLDFFNKYPKLMVKCDSIPIYWTTKGQKDYRFSVYLNLPKYEENKGNLNKMFKEETGERVACISDLMDEYCQIEKKREELRGKIKCILNTLKSYARVKNEFPEAYKLLVEKIDKETLPAEDFCTDIEGLRAELTVK